MNKIKFLFSFFILFFFINSQNITKIISIENLISEKNTNKNFQKFYSYEIPENYSSNSMLIITLSENFNIENDYFNDANIYVSKTNKFPTSKQNSTYFSEIYGTKFISIPSNEITKNEIFYIGISCENYCDYSLKLEFSKEFPLNISSIYTITINKEKTLSYFYQIPNIDYNEFNIIANNKFFKSFKIFVSKENSPSSTNTFKPIPAWTGGFMFSIKKNSNEFCKNCSFHIIIQSENDDVQIQLFSYFQNSLVKLNIATPIFDALQANEKRCYEIELKKQKKFIIHSTFFSGNGLMFISGWRDLSNLTISEIKSSKNNKYEIINSENLILLNEEDFQFFNNDSFFNNSLFFCFVSNFDSSYYLNTYYLSQIQDLQKYNLIFPGNEFQAFLPKDQATKYNIFNFNHDNQNSIHILSDSIKGKVYVYLFFCLEFYCRISKQFIDDNKQKLVHGNYISFNKKEIILKPEDNLCLQNKNSICNPYVLVLCQTENIQDEFCLYKLQMKFDDSTIFLTPKKTFQGFITKNKLDKYEFIIQDNQINSFIIILNPISGKFSFNLKKTKDNNNNDINEIIENYSSSQFIPNVIRIKKNSLINLVGKYEIEIEGISFGSYTIFYYTTFEHNNKIDFYEPDFSDITAFLEDGIIIKDYFPNDIFYKIYSYSPKIKEKTDIKIILNRINYRFIFKVFLDLKNLKISSAPKNFGQKQISGFLWKSDYYGELVIKKNDPNFSVFGPYFIVVEKDPNYFESPFDINAILEFSLGVSTINKPFILNEGNEHYCTLNRNFISQSYLFIHSNLQENFEINVNVLYGTVDVFLDVEFLNENSLKNKINLGIDDFENNFGSFMYKKRIKDSIKFDLNEEFFKNYCNKTENNCNIYIYIKNSNLNIVNNIESQFFIFGKSSSKNFIQISPGIATTDSVKIGECKHFKIEEIQQRKKGSVFSVIFFNGLGEIYLKIYDNVNNNNSFPNENYYDYKGKNAFKGKNIFIPEFEFDVICKNSPKLFLFFSVCATKLFNFNENEIQFSLTYSNEIKRINQNEPFNSFISAGEEQFFSLFFGENTKNIYITLNNMNGDADLYLNYGENFPSSSNYHWKSISKSHEHLDISIEDEFFKNKSNFFDEKIVDNIGGYYTLLIKCYKNTSYTLFIRNLDFNYLPLIDNFPVNCKCQKKTDKCFFKYDDVFNKNNLEIDENQIIFTNQFFYGSGILYLKLLNNVTNKNSDEFLNLFPDENDYDYSNFNSNQRNYINYKIPKEKYSRDSIILLTFICDEKTETTINSISLNNEGVKNGILDINKENLFYIYYNSKNKDKKTFLYFFQNQPEDLTFYFTSHLGKAEVNIYIKEEENYFALYNFILDSTEKSSSNYKDQKTKKNGLIKYHKNLINYNIIFEIKPFSNFGFNLQLIYDKTLVKVPINVDKTFLVKNYEFRGYFDIINEYKNIEINLNIADSFNYRANIYLNINYLEKNKNENNLDDNNYNYIFPSKFSYQFKSQTEPILGNSILLISDFENNQNSNKIIRAVFLIEIEKINVNINTYDEYDIPQNQRENDLNEIEINLIISPSINKVKKIKALPFQYYFTNHSTSIDGSLNYKENSKIFELNRINNDDDILVIQISLCQGLINYAIYEKIPKDEFNQEKINELSKDEVITPIDNNQLKILVPNIEKNKKHYYLKIWPQSSINAEINDIFYLFYYYTTTKSKLDFFTIKENISFKESGYSKAKIKLPQIFLNDDRKYDDLQFDIFLTSKKKEFNKLNNICYITKEISNNNNSDIQYIPNVKINNGIITFNHLKNEKNYYVNIIIKNIKTNELITFNPIEIKAGKIISNNLLNKIISIFFIFGLIVALIILIYQNIKQKKIIQYEQSDIQKMASIPGQKTTEMQKIQSDFKYHSLMNNVN